MRYFMVFFTFLKLNLSQEMEFRSNFAIRLLTQFFYVVVQIVLIETYFRFTNSIGSWSRPEVFVLAGIFRLIEGIFHIIFHANLLYLPEMVRLGELDLYMTRPINALFLLSVSKQQWYELSTFASGIFILLYFLPRQTGGLWLTVILFSFLGLICLYSIMLAISSLSFYLNRFTAISSIWDVISKTNRFPLDIFGRVAAPFLLVATIPSRIILGKSGIEDVMVQIAGSAILFLLAYKFWQHSLKRYSSASS